MGRHLSHSRSASWARVVRGLFHRGAWGVGSWATVAVLAVIPAGAVSVVWLVLLAEPLTDAGSAAVSAIAAGAVTWVVVVLACRRYFRRARPTGRHSAEERQGTDPVTFRS